MWLRSRNIWPKKQACESHRAHSAGTRYSGLSAVILEQIHRYDDRQGNTRKQLNLSSGCSDAVKDIRVNKGRYSKMHPYIILGEHTLIINGPKRRKAPVVGCHEVHYYKVHLLKYSFEVFVLQVVPCYAT